MVFQPPISILADRPFTFKTVSFRGGPLLLRPMADEQHFVTRLLNTPDIARVVPRLAPEVLYRVIERCGLEDCVDLVALATPRQLERVLDFDLWRAPVAGADEAFDAGRFGLWLEVLAQSGAAAAADQLAAMDVELVVDGLAAHVAVFDAAAVAPFTSLDGEQIGGRTFDGAQVCGIGGFVVERRSSSAWDAIVELLTNLQDERPAFFGRVMRGCVAVSDGAREADGFHVLLNDRDQHRSDLAADRESRRETQGYVAPAQARAFLQAAREPSLDGAQPPPDAVARACMRAILQEPPAANDDPARPDAPSAPAETSSTESQSVTTVMDVLYEAGVLARPRALITAGDTEGARLALVHAFVDAHVSAAEELAFLANAVLAGCAIQGRPFTPQEASDVVIATCNLGLENWPSAWASRDLVTAFQIGWGLLHRDLCRHAAAALIDVLADLECVDREVQWALQMLRRDLIRHVRDGEPWRARQALDAILMLDAPAWAALLALLDECPTLHAGLAASGRPALRVDPAAFTFVARNSEIASARRYLASLSGTLAG